jgi:DNA-binding NtrC family response regulator
MTAFAEQQLGSRVLIVDDDRALGETLVEGLGPLRFEPSWCPSATDALAAVDRSDFDVVLTDLKMRGLGGIELCERLSASRPDVPVVVLTAFGSFETALQALRAGAYDFVTKPIELETLAHTLRRAAEHRLLRSEVRRLRLAARHDVRDELLGKSAGIERVRSLVSRVADVDVAVLITGESGVGKGLVARLLHQNGARAGGPIVTVGCAGATDEQVEAELFGQTDAVGLVTRAGAFARAEGGTLVLDEVGSLSLPLQRRLVHLLQSRPLGASGEQRAPRVVATTHQDLEGLVQEGRFREDLYYRVNVVQIDVPPLRARGGDVLQLAQRFLDEGARASRKRVTGLSSRAAERLLAYGWPGNVRELEAAIERAVALTEYEHLTVDDLPAKLRGSTKRAGTASMDEPGEILPLEAVEQRHILYVLEAVGGNKSLAAQLLGVDRKTLHRRLDRWGAA